MNEQPDFDSLPSFRPRDTFSSEELTVLGDPRPFLVREKVMANLRDAFDELRYRLAGHVERGNYLAPEGVDYNEGKIGQGEHLDGLPYVYVDMPRFFTQEASFTFRTLFWWGHGVSFSLILGGQHLAHYRERLLENLPILQALDVHVSVAPTPWDWKRGAGHTIPLDPGKEPQLLDTFKDQSFLKCCRFLDFNDEDFRQNRVDDAGLYTFQTMEPLILA